MIKILFLAANPLNTDRLRLDEEVRAIDEALRRADFRNQFELHSHWAVRVEDLQDLLLRYTPDIVHFSGHGQGTRFVQARESPPPDSTDVERHLVPLPEGNEETYSVSGQIVLQDVNGKSAPVPPRALSTLFRVLKDNIRCVVLNACYSQAQAEGIAQHIDCVIGMSDAIPDVTAIVFATAFYRGLGYGRSLQLAFDLGCSQIDLSALRGSSIPQLIALRTNADRLVLAADGALTQSEVVIEQAPGEPPYKGLQYFDTGDERLFFGRERLTAELADYLRTHNFLAVVGASGSGKSSVVRAGLVPALQRGEPLLDGLLPPVGSAQWSVHIMTPKAHPLKELAATLMQDSVSDLEQIRLKDDLAEDERVLDARASRLLSRSTANRLLLVVDQFEELFTLCRDQTERKAFVDNLLTAATEDGVTTVVITLRADFYAHCSQFSNLRLALESQQKYIGPMNRDELRRAIEGPAKQEGWEFETGLVDLLLHDVGDEPGALPLLSHALLETWNRRRGRTLTLSGYVESGRVQGAIAQTAERVFKQQLTPEQQAIAKNIFLRLTELGEGVEDTRRRVQRAELLPQTESNAPIETVLKTLADARLVTTDKDEVEVAHEALIREWPQLRKWLAENRESLRMQRTVGEAAKSWAALGKDAGALYSGLRLQQALAWQRENDVMLTPLEATFLHASKRRRDLQRGLLMTVAVAILAVLGWLSWGQVNEIRYDRAMQAVSPFIVTGDADGATAKLQAAAALFPEHLDLDAQIANVNRQVATQLVQTGETMARNGDYTGAEAKFKAALALNPPSDTPVYVWIEAGEFTMGEASEAHTVDVDGFWIGRTEVTNAQYLRCIAAKACEPPTNQRYTNPAWANHPVANVTWLQAKTYAAWVGGRLPTEAEWEKACRGTDKRIYPWGTEEPTYERANFGGNNVSTTAVGSYPAGANGLYDMAGNVWEWTSSKYQNYPYDLTDGRENPEGNDPRTLRGGSWGGSVDFVRCAYRVNYGPDNYSVAFGFRVVVSSPGF